MLSSWSPPWRCWRGAYGPLHASGIRCPCMPTEMTSADSLLLRSAACEPDGRLVMNLQPVHGTRLHGSRMFKRRNIYLLLAGAAIFITTTVCGLGSSSPAHLRRVPLPAATAPSITSLPTSTTEQPGLPIPPAPPPAIPEARRVTVEYPSKNSRGQFGCGPPDAGSRYAR